MIGKFKSFDDYVVSMDLSDRVVYELSNDHFYKHLWQQSATSLMRMHLMIMDVKFQDTYAALGGFYDNHKYLSFIAVLNRTRDIVYTAYYLPLPVMIDIIKTGEYERLDNVKRRKVGGDVLIHALTDAFATTKYDGPTE